MAMKKAKVSASKPVENDNTITKAVYAMAIFCIMFWGYNILKPHLVINDNLSLVLMLVRISKVICIVVAVASVGIVAYFRKKKPVLVMPLVALTVLMLAAATTFDYLASYWASYSPSTIYIAYVGLLVLYLIRLIYPAEFLLVSCTNAIGALTFFNISRDEGSVLFTVLFVVLLVALNGMIYMGSKNKGKVGKVKVFNGSLVAMIPYGNAVFLVICLIGSLVLGELFAYYAMYAVGAVELALAVYYTVKLA
ncbi:MAG: hypothetical protein R3Y62_05610 [Eubacteriales bacterium]